jgi:hypothetical protein
MVLDGCQESAQPSVYHRCRTSKLGDHEPGRLRSPRAAITVAQRLPAIIVRIPAGVVPAAGGGGRGDQDDGVGQRPSCLACSSASRSAAWRPSPAWRPGKATDPIIHPDILKCFLAYKGNQDRLSAVLGLGRRLLCCIT